MSQEQQEQERDNAADPDAGSDGDSAQEGAQKLGPSSLRHHEDGSVTIEGEDVHDPEEHKGEPIPGGPSDPDPPPDPAMPTNRA